MALKFLFGVLVFVTALSGVFAFAAFQTGQQSGASLLFVVGLVGLAIIAAIDSRKKTT